MPGTWCNGSGQAWDCQNDSGYKLCLETIQKAVHFPWGKWPWPLFFGNYIGGFLEPIHMTHGRCFVGLTRSFNPRKDVFFSHTLYPFRQIKCI
jgi:hypothetical protein